MDNWCDLIIVRSFEYDGGVDGMAMIRCFVHEAGKLMADTSSRGAQHLLLRRGGAPGDQNVVSTSFRLPGR
jgi:hypothetical protein